MAEYKKKMRAAGIEAESMILKGTVHGFFTQPGLSVFFSLCSSYSYHLHSVCKMCIYVMIMMADPSQARLWQGGGSVAFRSILVVAGSGS